MVGKRDCLSKLRSKTWLVYFNQLSGAGHLERWTKYALLTFYLRKCWKRRKNAKKLMQNLAKKTSFWNCTRKLVKGFPVVGVVAWECGKGTEHPSVLGNRTIFQAQDHEARMWNKIWNTRAREKSFGTWKQEFSVGNAGMRNAMTKLRIAGSGGGNGISGLRTRVEWFLKKVLDTCHAVLDCYGTPNPKLHFDLLLFLFHLAQGLGVPQTDLPVTIKSAHKKFFHIFKGCTWNKISSLLYLKA